MTQCAIEDVTTINLFSLTIMFVGNLKWNSASQP